MNPPRNFTLRLRPQLAQTAAQAAPLKHPVGVLVLPPELSRFQAFINKVHRLATR